MPEIIDELEALREENAKLRAKNDKLYKDCVSFAKRIKASENNADRIEELEAEKTEEDTSWRPITCRCGPRRTWARRVCSTS